MPDTQQKNFKECQKARKNTDQRDKAVIRTRPSYDIDTGIIRQGI